MNYIHDSLVFRHTGFERTLKRARNDFFWVGIKTNIQTYFRHCEICQRAKGENIKPSRLLQPLPIPTKLWSSISMDFIEGPKSY
jgi:hypothetical protein